MKIEEGTTLYQLVYVVSYWSRQQKVRVAPILDFEVVGSYEVEVTVGKIETADPRNDSQFLINLGSLLESRQRLVGFCTPQGVLDDAVAVKICSIHIIHGQQQERSVREEYEVLDRMVDLVLSNGRRPALTPSELRFPQTRDSQHAP